MTKLKYKLVKRKLNFGAQKGKVVYIAQPVNLGKIGFDDLVKEASDGSTVDACQRSFRLSIRVSMRMQRRDCTITGSGTTTRMWEVISARTR